MKIGNQGAGLNRRQSGGKSVVAFHSGIGHRGRGAADGRQPVDQLLQRRQLLLLDQIEFLKDMSAKFKNRLVP